MAYGKIKADAFIYDDGGSDTEITAATIASNSNKAPTASPTFTGTVTLPGTVQVGGQATDITMGASNANALEFKQGSDTYLKFDTNDQSVQLSKPMVSSSDITLNAQQEVRFADSDSSKYIAFASPATVGTNSTWTLPSDAPSASDVLTVTSVSSNNPTLEWAPASGGKILQVVAGTVVDTPQSFSSNSTWTDSGVSVSITPSSSSSKIYVTGITSWGLSNGGYSSHFGLWRGSTQIDAGSTSGDVVGRYIMSWTSYGQYAFYLYPVTLVDSPSTTSQITYKYRVKNSSSTTVYLNRHVVSDNYYAASKLIAWEIDNS